MRDGTLDLMRLSLRVAKYRRAVRFVVTALVTITLLTLMDLRIVEAERDGCHRRQQIFKEGILKPLDDAVRRQRAEVRAESHSSEKPQEMETLRVLKRRRSIVKGNIVADCTKAYPHAIPFVD